jgi:hypothetical protein
MTTLVFNANPSSLKWRLFDAGLHGLAGGLDETTDHAAGAAPFWRR